MSLSDSDDDPDYVPPADGPDTPDEDEHEPADAPPPTKDPTDQKKRRDALWADFQASVSTPPADGHASANRVRVEKTYLFAGKHVTEVVEVPEDSEEAKKWPRAPVPSSIPCGEAPPPDVDSNPSTPAAKRPGPRKPRTTLPSLPSKSSHAKKITTLDKSAMDWRAHVATQSGDVKDQLETNRRGGGYLEKVDFLRRVQDRREDALEASKSNKRRKT